MTSEYTYLIVKNEFIKYPYSKTSLLKLLGLHPSLVSFALSLAKIIDCKIISGVRTDKEQLELFNCKESNFDGIIKKSNHQV